MALTESISLRPTGVKFRRSYIRGVGSWMLSWKELGYNMSSQNLRMISNPMSVNIKFVSPISP